MKHSLLFLLLALLALPTQSVAQDKDIKTDTKNTQEILADPELDEALEKWANEYVRYIITRQERAEWDNLKDRVDKLKFIEWFWQRRDTDPKTPVNEYRVDYQKRWRYVQKNFTAGKPGWKTDRGRIYLTLGAPSNIERNPFGRKSSERPSEIWFYNSLNNKRLAAAIEINFVDFLGYGDYEIVTDLDRTAEFNSAFGISMNALDAYAVRRPGEIRQETDETKIITSAFSESKIRDESLISRQLFDLQDELREVAKVPELSIRAAREKIRTEIARGEMTFGLSADAFSATGGAAYVPVTLSLPLSSISYTVEQGDRHYQASLYARIKGGDVFQTFEDTVQFVVPFEDATEARPDQPAALDKNYLYQFWYLVPPGTYEITVTLRDTISQAVGNKVYSLTIPAFGGTDLVLSPIVVADLLADAPQNSIMKGGEHAPFQIAGRRVIPNVARVISLDQGSFSLFFQVYNAKIDLNAGAARLKVQYFLYRNGSLFSKTPASALELKHQDRTSVETTFQTQALGVGEYRVLAVVTDEIAGTEARGEVNFSIITPAPKIG